MPATLPPDVEAPLSEVAKAPGNRKPLPYRFTTPEARRVTVPDRGKVGRGVNVKSEEAHLLMQEGRSQQALYLPAIVTAIAADILPRADILTVWREAHEDGSFEFPPALVKALRAFCDQIVPPVAAPAAPASAAPGK